LTFYACCLAEKLNVYQIEEKIVRNNVVKLLKQLKSDENGAALVEYTVLLGIMLVAVIATITLVGGWVTTKWAALNTAL
jgi:pilus assembly protein Flp/PilA